VLWLRLGWAEQCHATQARMFTHYLAFILVFIYSESVALADVYAPVNAILVLSCVSTLSARYWCTISVRLSVVCTSDANSLLCRNSCTNRQIFLLSVRALILVFFVLKRHYKIRRVTPSTGALNTGARKNLLFRPKLPFVSETVWYKSVHIILILFGMCEGRASISHATQPKR